MGLSAAEIEAVVREIAPVLTGGWVQKIHQPTPHAITLAQAVRPEVALISVGAGNRYGHPTPDTLAALGGITTFRTDRDGTVEVSLDGPGLVVRAHANGLPPPRRGSVPYAPARR